MNAAFADQLRSELDDQPVSEPLRRRVQEWLAEDKEFNVWFLVTTKRALADDDLMALLDGYRETQDLASSAWEDFQEGHEDAPLLEALARSIARMRELRDR